MSDEFDTQPAAGTYRGYRAPAERRRRSSAVAQFLSFLWPGFGQFYLSQGLRGVLYALPPLLLIGALLFLVARSPAGFALQLLVPAFAVGALVLLAIHGLWRVLSIVDAWNSARTRPVSRDSSTPLMVVLALVVIVAHAFAGYYLYSFTSAGARVFQGGDGPLDELTGKTPGGALPTSGPINVLFVGVDSAANRDHALTDTIMLSSFDPQTERVVQISIPRDTGRLPMYDGTVYPNRINSLVSYARRNPDQYPDGGIPTLAREVGYLLGVDVHYYAVVNMEGFKRLVDLVGGVTVNVTKPIADPQKKLYLEPGPVHLDGDLALTFVRSRYGPGNSDYERARRQQQVLRALGQRMLDPSVVARLPEIMSVGSELARTNVPLDNANQLLALIGQADQAETRQVVLAPRKYARRIPPAEVGGRFMTELKMDAVAELSVELFGDHSRYTSAGQP